jgi:ATP-dependent Clp protease adapter protein ClpS
MQFVVEVLIDIHTKSIDEAEQIMMTTHLKGWGIASIYTRDICKQTVNSAISRP